MSEIDAMPEKYGFEIVPSPKYLFLALSVFTHNSEVPEIKFDIMWNCGIFQVIQNRF